MEVFRDLTSTELTPEQEARIVAPNRVYPRQQEVLAIHWHPEWVPLPLAKTRVLATFPTCQQALIIPTQHNELLALDNYAGVEVDCFSLGFNRKVQLLLHFKQDRLPQAVTLKSMLKHTQLYRSGQLWELTDSLWDPKFEARLQEAAEETGANQELVDFMRLHAGKFRCLLRDHEPKLKPIMVKNKLLSDYFAALRQHFPDKLIGRALFLIKAVKQIVKREFSPQYFYRASEVIEEARHLGGRVVIPHPEQFWPILLADYDVDGYEVWNPQSREYTEFLITGLHRQNRQRGSQERPLLVFMGDDTHLGEKTKPPEMQDRLKASREVGLQTAWDDPLIRKQVMLAGMDRGRVISEYQERLG
ncbi:MAG: hypothetical protein HY794_10440 [Desulfarculus sp.]|nr:hypothetical protein [Desulfarculus sp.]